VWPFCFAHALTKTPDAANIVVTDNGFHL